MVLEAFLCPLTKKVFTDPVVCLGDGVTYERSAIESILDAAKLSHKPTVLSPVTNGEIDVWAGCLVPNRALKDAILTIGPEGSRRTNTRNSYDDEEEEHPCFECPVANKLYEEPVLNVVDGFTYDRESLDLWFKGMGKRTSPMTNLLQWTTASISNVALKRAIREYKSLDGKYTATTTAPNPPVPTPLFLTKQKLIDDALAFLADACEMGEEGRGHAVLGAICTLTSCPKARQAGLKCVYKIYSPADMHEIGFASRDEFCVLMGKLLREWKMDRDSQLELFGYVTAMTADATYSDMRVKLGEIGACRAVVDAFSEYPNDRDIFFEGLALILNLVYKADANSILLADAGVCDKVVEGMARFMGDKDVQQRGCMVVSNLAYEVESVSKKMVASGGCEAIAKAMQAFEDVSEVILEGCTAVCCLGYFCKENRVRLAAAGFCEIMIRAMKNFPKNVEIQREACMSISNICHEVPENVVLLGDAGACEVVVSALSSFGTDASLVVEAVITMDFLSSTRYEANLKRLREMEAIRATVDALVACAADASVRKRACTFLVRFCSEVEYKGIIDKLNKVTSKTREELKKAFEEAKKKKRETKENTR